jgi:hypothetical protein
MELINNFTNCHNGEFEYYSNEKGRELLNKSLPLIVTYKF